MSVVPGHVVDALIQKGDEVPHTLGTRQLLAKEQFSFCLCGKSVMAGMGSSQCHVT